MAKQKLLVVVEVNEEELYKAYGFNELPEKITETLDRLRALETNAIYLLNPKIDALAVIDAIALDYHHYAVSVRGEKCNERCCDQHSPNTSQTILNAHYYKRNRPPQGIN